EVVGRQPGLGRVEPGPEIGRQARVVPERRIALRTGRARQRIQVAALSLVAHAVGECRRDSDLEQGLVSRVHRWSSRGGAYLRVPPRQGMRYIGFGTLQTWSA